MRRRHDCHILFDRKDDGRFVVIRSTKLKIGMLIITKRHFHEWMEHMTSYSLRHFREATFCNALRLALTSFEWAPTVDVHITKWRRKEGHCGHSSFHQPTMPSTERNCETSQAFGSTTTTYSRAGVPRVTGTTPAHDVKYLLSKLHYCASPVRLP